jgi:hypothetical protein
VSKYKVGDLVQWYAPSRSTAILHRKGFIVAIREDLEDPEGKGDLVYDIQWFGHDRIDRMIDIWFDPLTTEVRGEQI